MKEKKTATSIGVFILIVVFATIIGISYIPSSLAVNPSEGYDIDMMNATIITNPLELVPEGFSTRIFMENTGDKDIGFFRLIGTQFPGNGENVTKTITMEGLMRNETTSEKMVFPLHKNSTLEFIIQPPVQSGGANHIFDSKKLVVHYKDFKLKITNKVESNSSQIIVLPNFDRELYNNHALRISYELNDGICENVKVKFKGNEIPLDYSVNEMIVSVNLENGKSWKASDIQLICNNLKIHDSSFFYGIAFADSLSKFEQLDKNIQFEIIPKQFYCINEKDLCHTFTNNTLDPDIVWDALWKIVGITIGLGGIIITLVTYMIQRRDIERVELS